MGFELSDDYVDVAARIREFRDKFPHGSLRPADTSKPYEIVTIGDKTYVVYAAAAYRDPGDMFPGIGLAWEPFPGKTPYTRDSELMNAETSAWGRAIVAALGADTKKVATRDEVERRRAEDDLTPPVVEVPDFGLSVILAALRGCQIKQEARNVHALAKAWSLLGEPVNGGGMRLAEVITSAGHILPEEIDVGDADDDPPVVGAFGDRPAREEIQLPAEGTTPHDVREDTETEREPVDTENARAMRAEAEASWSDTRADLVELERQQAMRDHPRREEAETDVQEASDR